MNQRRAPAAAAVVVLAATLLSGCGDPCEEWEEYDRKAYAEGAYFEYEDRIQSAKRRCLAEYGVSP